MSYSPLTTPFFRFPSTLSSPTYIATTHSLYLIQQQLTRSLLFDTASINIACVWYSKFDTVPLLLVFDTVTSISWASSLNLSLQCASPVFSLSSAFSFLLFGSYIGMLTFLKPVFNFSPITQAPFSEFLSDGHCYTYPNHQTPLLSFLSVILYRFLAISFTETSTSSWTSSLPFHNDISGRFKLL